MRELLRIWAIRVRDYWARLLIIPLIGTIAAVIAERTDFAGLASSAEYGYYDSGVTAFASPKRSKDIVILAIDDKTFEEVVANPSFYKDFGAWPYHRSVWARVVDFLAVAGAKAVVFDATMDEPHPDPSGDLAFAEYVQRRNLPFYMGVNGVPRKIFELPKVEAPENTLPGPVDRAPPTLLKRDELARKAEEAGEKAKGEQGGGDEQFPSDDGEQFPADDAAEQFPSDDAEQFPADDASGSPGEANQGKRPPTPEETAARAWAAKKLAFAKRFAMPIEVRGLTVRRMLTDETVTPEGKVIAPVPTYPKPPIEPLWPVLAGFGLVPAEPDGDGKLRRSHFVYTDGANLYPTLPLAVAADLYGAKEIVLEPHRLVLGEKTIRVNREGDAEIDYNGTLFENFETVPLVNVLWEWARLHNGEPPLLPPDTFKDKVVMIGGFALGTADVKTTPFANNTPGIAKQAAELQNLIDGRFIVRAPFWGSVLFAFVVALLSCLIITIVKHSLVELIYPFALIYGFFYVTGFILDETRIHLSSAMPMFAGTVANALAILGNLFVVRKEKEFQRTMFSRYMEKPLVEMMITQKQLPVLDGERAEITAFFSDIRGFSTISEQYRNDPKTLVKMLHEYLGRVTRVLQANQGCVDKYIGDAVVCLFGAPIKDKDHAFHACQAALAVKHELEALNAEFAAKGWPEFHTRIGVNSAEMFVGNIGSDELFDYTAVGDGMNLAARLEAANKAYGTVILVGPRTVELCAGRILFREIDEVTVPGKHQVVTLFEVLAETAHATTQHEQSAKLYAQALSLYRQQRFAAAANLLDQALAVWRQDGAAKALRQKCEALLREPPPSFRAVSALEK